ncbi:MAG: response regulator [bacterium]
MTELNQNTILVVDDTPANINLLRKILKNQYKILVAATGKQALEIIHTIPAPDLILLDVMMPGIDGYEVCRQLQADDSTADIPVIFVTAKSEIENEEAGFKLGAVDYITKPISPTIVLARVKTHMALSLARKKLEEQNIELLESARLKEDVENITRHDLKAPLTCLIGMPSLVLSGGNLTSEQEEFLTIIEESSYRMLHMINSSLDLYKMEKKSYLFNPTAVNVYAVAKKVIRELHNLLDAKKCEVLIDIDTQPATSNDNFIVWAEELLTYSLLENLLKNAIEASPEECKITISFTNGEQPHVAIHNFGAVPEALRDKFFEKYTTDGKKGGTGLGTYSAQLMIKTQGGSIAMQTSTDDGTTITITFLPISTGNHEKIFSDNQLDTCSEEVIEQLIIDHPLRVLVVDDNSSNRQLIERYLEHPMIVRDMAVDGDSAFALVQSNSYDFILLDLEMPGMDGLKTISQIRLWEKQNTQLPNRVIALSGHDDIDTIKRCQDAGFTDYIKKPIDKSAFLNLLICNANTSASVVISETSTGTEPYYTVIISNDLQDLIPKFLIFNREGIVKIQTAVDADDYDTVRSVCHNLKGSASMYGFSKLSALFSTVESAALVAQRDNIINGIAALNDYLNKVNIQYQQNDSSITSHNTTNLTGEENVTN